MTEEHDDILDLFSNAVFGGDYTNEFEELVRSSFDMLKFEDVELRTKASEVLIDRYIEQTGERPPNASLGLLGHAILYDHLEGDTASNKSQVVEFPILTEAQYLRRTRGQGSAANKTGETYREVYADVTQLASDNKDYRLPIRRYD